MVFSKYDLKNDLKKYLLYFLWQKNKNICNAEWACHGFDLYNVFFFIINFVSATLSFT